MSGSLPYTLPGVPDQQSLYSVILSYSGIRGQDSHETLKKPGSPGFSLRLSFRTLDPQYTACHFQALAPGAAAAPPQLSISPGAAAAPLTLHVIPHFLTGRFISEEEAKPGHQPFLSRTFHPCVSAPRKPLQRPERALGAGTIRFDVFSSRDTSLIQLWGRVGALYYLEFHGTAFVWSALDTNKYLRMK